MSQPNEQMLNRLYGLSDQDKFTAQFPQDIQNVPHIAIFRAYKFQRLSRQEPSRLDCIGEIILPMPSNLNTAYHAEYATPSIGALSENLVSKVNANSATPADMFTKVDGDTAIKAATGVAVSNVVEKLGQTVATLSGAFGVARNPHKIVMYQGSDFRTHSFEYQFTPKNQKESFEITNIIKAFKFYMSASYGIGNLDAGFGKIAGFVSDDAALGTAVADFAREAAAQSRAFFEYPEVFRITLMPDGQTDNPHIFQIAECVLEDFKVDYDPQGGARYVRGENNVPAPASVRISMSFKETSIVTKEDIRNKVRAPFRQSPSGKDMSFTVDTGSGL